MKKIAIALILLTFVVGLAAPSYAAIRRDRSALRGKLVSVDRAKQEVVVKEDGSGKDVKFTFQGAIEDNLVSGSNVVVIYKIGTNEATTVRIPSKK